MLSPLGHPVEVDNLPDRSRGGQNAAPDDLVEQVAFMLAVKPELSWDDAVAALAR
jgi:hypothetical protein